MADDNNSDEFNGANNADGTPGDEQRVPDGSLEPLAPRRPTTPTMA